VLGRRETTWATRPGLTCPSLDATPHHNLNPAAQLHPMDSNDPEDNGEVPPGAGAPLVAPDGQVFVREVSGGLSSLPGLLRRRQPPSVVCRALVGWSANRMAWLKVSQADHLLHNKCSVSAVVVNHVRRIVRGRR